MASKLKVFTTIFQPGQHAVESQEDLIELGMGSCAIEPPGGGSGAKPGPGPYEPPPSFGATKPPKEIANKATQRLADTSPPPFRRIMVVGDSGAGKSSFVNALVGRNVARVGDFGDMPCTTQLTAFKVGGGAKADSGDFYVDTVGVASEFYFEQPLDESQNSKINDAAFSEACQAWYNVYQALKVGISKIILVLKVVDRINTLLEPLLQKMLGEDFHKNTILVINRADKLATTVTTVEKYLNCFQPKSPLRKFVEKFMNRPGGHHDVFLTCLSSADPLAAPQVLLKEEIRARMKEEGDSPLMYLKSRGGFWEFFRTHVFPYISRFFQSHFRDDFGLWLTALEKMGCRIEFPDEDCCVCCSQMCEGPESDGEAAQRQQQLLQHADEEEGAPLLLNEPCSQVFISKCYHVFHSACIRQLPNDECPFCRRKGIKSTPLYKSK